MPLYLDYQATTPCDPGVVDTLPRDYIEISIEPLAATSRRFRIGSTGPKSMAVVAALRERLGQ